MSDTIAIDNPPATRGVSRARDALLMIVRSVRLSRRNVDALLTGLMLPVMMMVLFVYLFGGAIQTGTEYVTYVVPGVLVLCASFGAALTAVSVTQDMTNGIMERFRSMDVPGAAVLTGHVVASTARNLVSGVMVLAVALLLGFRPGADVLEWLGAAGILALYIVAVSAISAACGLITRTPEAAGGVSFFVMFLPYPSSGFVPIHTMPSWLHGFAEHQPATPIIESLRGFLLGQPVGDNAWLAIAWCVGIITISVAVAGVLFRRRSR